MGVLNKEKLLPSTEDEIKLIKAGDTYKVGHLGYFENNVYYGVDEIPAGKADLAVYIGDLIIADEDGKLSFTHISSGYESENEAALRYIESDKALRLINPVGIDLGSVKMVGSEDSNVRVSAAQVTGVLGDTVTYSFQLEWEDWDKNN